MITLNSFHYTILRINRQWSIIQSHVPKSAKTGHVQEAMTEQQLMESFTF